MMPVVDRLEDEFGGQVQIVRLNAAVPAEETLAQAYELRNHPAFVVIDAQGQIAVRLFGVQPIAQMRSALQAVVK